MSNFHHNGHKRHQDLGAVIEVVLAAAMAQAQIPVAYGFQLAPPRDAATLIQALRSAPILYERHRTAPSKGPCPLPIQELRAEEIDEQLVALGETAHATLVEALRDPDPRLREIVVFVLTLAALPPQRGGAARYALAGRRTHQAYLG